MSGLSDELHSRLAKTVWTCAGRTPLEIDAISLRAESRSMEVAALRTLIAEHHAREIIRAAQPAVPMTPDSGEEF